MCISPIMIKKAKDCAFTAFSHHAVPCGKCYECRMARGAGWAFRLMQEHKRHTVSAFITLTYEDAFLPMADCGRPTLIKSDVQKYFKRVRKGNPKGVKYYACGEYGSRSFRPHYHAIVFSAGYGSLANNWDFGHVRIDPVEPASIAYVSGYCNKPQHKFTDGRVPEFSLMSKGLGSNYLTPEMVSYHQANMASFVTLPGGVKKGLPRYYRDKMFNDEQRRDLAAVAAAKHELDRVNGELAVGFDQYERSRNESVKAGIKRFVYNSKMRNKL